MKTYMHGKWWSLEFGCFKEEAAKPYFTSVHVILYLAYDPSAMMNSVYLSLPFQFCVV